MTRCRTPAVVACAASMLLAGGAPARAATVSVAAGTVTVQALPGETNTLSLRLPDEQGGVSVSDAAGLDAGEGCIPQSPTSAQCLGPITRVVLTLRDGDDKVVVQDGGTASFVLDAGDGADAFNAPSAGPTEADGGAGDDTIVAGSASDHLIGGGGADLLIGGAGKDRLAGGEGDDRLTGGLGRDELRGGPGADLLKGDEGIELSNTGALAAEDDLDGGDGDDTLDAGPGGDGIAGGGGLDTVSYASRVVGVSVRLDGVRNDGESGEGDAVAGDVEAVVAGAGHDTLIGGASADSLDGGNGDDVIEGGGGDDRLTGSNGVDRLNGGPGTDVADGGTGDDRLEMRDGLGEVVRCAEGTDTAILDHDDSDEVCEVVDRAARPAGAPASSGGGPTAAGSERAGLPDRRVGRAPGAGPQSPLGVPSLRGDVVLLPVHCPPGGSACRISAAVRLILPRPRGARRGAASPRRLAGRRIASLAPGSGATVEVRLSAGARRLLRRHRRLRASAEVIVRRGGTTGRYARPLVIRS